MIHLHAPEAPAIAKRGLSVALLDRSKQAECGSRFDPNSMVNTIKTIYILAHKAFCRARISYEGRA
jgi:hypothetical protein